MWVELTLPAEVAEVLPPPDEARRGPSEITVIVDAIGTVSNVITVGQALKAAPDLARHIRAWRQGHSGRSAGAEHEEPRLLIKAPGVHIEIDLPPNVPSNRIAEALARALQSELENESGSSLK